LHEEALRSRLSEGGGQMNDTKKHIEKTVYTSAHLRYASWRALEQAREHEKDRFYNCMSCIVFSAFCLEAYFNHLGERIIAFWATIERNLSPREKLDILSVQLDLHLDFGGRPFQSFRPIFRVRNSLAHGKTEHLFEEEAVEMPVAEWEEQITIENAERYFDDTRDMIEHLHDAADQDNMNPLWFPETAIWWED
jgi:hypothetical protein